MPVRRWLREAWDLIGADLPVFSLAACLTVALSLLSFLILWPPLVVGLCVMLLEKSHGRKPQLSHLWEGITEHFPASIVTWIIYILATIPFHIADSALQGFGKPWTFVGAGLALAGMGLVALPLFFTMPLIADRDLTAREALRTSWARVRPNLPAVAVTALAVGLVFLVGLFACGFGMILTLPLACAVWVLSYREIVGDFAAPRLTPLVAA